MSGRRGFRDVDAEAHGALKAFYDRTGWNSAYLEMPFARMMALEKDKEGLAAAEAGESSEVGEYELEQRFCGARALLKYFMSGGWKPADMLRKIAAAGRALHLEPWSLMTMEEVAWMEGQSTAAHSWRCKVISGEIVLSGQKGSRLPGQKSSKAVRSYQQCRKGNTSRADGEKRKHPRRREKVPGGGALPDF